MTSRSVDSLGRRAWLTALPLIVLAGCAGIGGPRTVEISRDELLRQLGQQFPLRNQILDVLEVTAQTPRLVLQPDHNRVLADVDLSARDRLFQRQYKGSLWLSFGLRYEPRDQTIRLHQVQIDKVSLSGLPEGYERHLTRLGSWLTQDRLQNQVVHRFSSQQLQQADRYGLTVTDIRVTSRGLAVVLGPKP